MNVTKKYALRPTSKKTLVLLVLGIVGVGIGWLVYQELKPKTIIYGDMSDRGKSYITTKKEGNDSFWNTVDLQGKVSGPSSQSFSMPDCFSITIPFAIKKADKKDDCGLSVSTENPNGRVVVYQKTMGISSVNDAPDVKLRDSKPDQYQKSMKSIGGIDYLIYKETNGMFVQNAFYYANGKLFGLTLSSSTNEDLTGKFEEILGSVRF
jgi:hypothetical protein